MPLSLFSRHYGAITPPHCLMPFSRIVCFRCSDALREARGAQRDAARKAPII